MKNMLTKFVLAAVCCMTVSVAMAGVGFEDPNTMTTTKMMNLLVKNYLKWGTGTNEYAAVWTKGNTTSQTNMLSATETALNKIYKNRDKNIAKYDVVKACIAAVESTGCLSCQSRPVGVTPTYKNEDGKTNVTWWIEWNKSHTPVPTPPLSRKTAN